MLILWEDHDKTLQSTSAHRDLPQPDSQLCATWSSQTADATWCQRSNAGLMRILSQFTLIRFLKFEEARKKIFKQWLDSSVSIHHMFVSKTEAASLNWYMFSAPVLKLDQEDLNRSEFVTKVKIILFPVKLSQILSSKFSTNLIWNKIINTTG